MWRRRSVVLAVLIAGLARAEPAAPETVEIPSGTLRLRGHLWKPAGPGPFPAVLFNHGSGGADAALTAGMPITEAAAKLAPLFVARGYVFLYPFRRGHGPSADQAPFMQDVLRREEALRGPAARQHLQDGVLLDEHLDDVRAALAFLATVPGVDARRIAVAGHSFGGQLALLAAAHDRSIRAAITFGAAAGSWARSPELQARLLGAVREARAAILLIHARNDLDTAPGRALAAELSRRHRPHRLLIYPPVGRTAEDGHNAVYGATAQWPGDVFEFLDEHLRR
jgi:dienelactone hydrolase